MTVQRNGIFRPDGTHRTPRILRRLYEA
jgi:hypothetical protein